MLGTSVVQFALAVVLPALIILAIVAVLLPEKDDLTFDIKEYKPSVPLDTADATQVIPVVKNYGHYDTFETKPVRAIFGEEMERKMMARVIAFDWLYEMGQKEKARMNALSATPC